MKTLLRRWYWWLPALLVAAGMVFVGYRAIHPPWKDTEAWAIYQQVSVGTTQVEVDAILDGKPGVHFSGPEEPATLVWRVDADFVGVALDHQGRVCRKWFEGRGHVFCDPPQEQVWDRLRARLGW